MRKDMKNISQTCNLQHCYEYENHEISISCTTNLKEFSAQYPKYYTNFISAKKISIFMQLCKY